MERGVFSMNRTVFRFLNIICNMEWGKLRMVRKETAQFYLATTQEVDEPPTDYVYSCQSNPCQRCQPRLELISV